MSRRKTDEEVAERFWEKVEKGESDECWLWKEPASDGYGYFSIERNYSRGAHRVSYLLTHGWNSLDGLEAAHQCENRACVNPGHLKAQTRSENMSAINAEKCRNGHVRTEENTQIRSNGKRRCRDCENDRQRERYWKERY